MKQTNRAKLPSSLAGIAAEHYVAAELSRRGYVASLTLRNTGGIDLLVANSTASKSVGIQVKAKQNAREWVLKEKAESYYSSNLFYIFVNLKRDILARPDFYIVPSKEVAGFTKEFHLLYLSTPSRSGLPHKPSSMRKFRDVEEQYLEKWDLLGL